MLRATIGTQLMPSTSLGMEANPSDWIREEYPNGQWYSTQVVSKAESDSDTFFVSLDYFYGNLLEKKWQQTPANYSVSILGNSCELF